MYNKKPSFTKINKRFDSFHKQKQQKLNSQNLPPQISGRYVNKSNFSRNLGENVTGLKYCNSQGKLIKTSSFTNGRLNHAKSTLDIQAPTHTSNNQDLHDLSSSNAFTDLTSNSDLGEFQTSELNKKKCDMDNHHMNPKLQPESNNGLKDYRGLKKIYNNPNLI